MSRTSPTLRLPKNDATLGPPDEQPQPEACKRKMADPTKHLLSFPEQSVAGLVWQGPTPLRGSQNRSHAGAPCWTSSVRGLRSGKLGCQWGSDMNRRAGLVVAILPHDTGSSRCLSRGLAHRVCSTRMAEGEPQRVTGGFGLTVPRTGRRGAPKLVAGLVPPQCLAQLAHAGGRGPKTNPQVQEKHEGTAPLTLAPSHTMW